MNTKLVVYCFLVAVVAVVYSENRMQQYLPILNKFCIEILGPNGAKFAACYQEEVKKLPGKYNGEQIFKACFGGVPTTSELKVKCDFVTGGPSVESQRNAFMQCLDDKLNSAIQGTGLTLEQAIAVGAKRVDDCS